MNGANITCTLRRKWEKKACVKNYITPARIRISASTANTRAAIGARTIKAIRATPSKIKISVLSDTLCFDLKRDFAFNFTEVQKNCRFNLRNVFLLAWAPYMQSINMLNKTSGSSFEGVLAGFSTCWIVVLNAINFSLGWFIRSRKNKDL